MKSKSALNPSATTPQQQQQHGKSIQLPTSTKLRPSEYLTQSLVDLPIEDYPMIIEFMNIKDNTSQIHSTVDIDKPIFHPSPNVLIFEDYAPFAIHEKKLYFRNCDKVARRIKILQTDSPFFEVSAPKNIHGTALKQSKIAAGMEVCFIVKFKPQEVRDYSIDLICVTEREKFLVPIRALGDRPRMSFPDEIQFGVCPVKSTSRKMILAQNIGSCIAKFRLNSLNSAFTCSSEDMIVEPGGSQMIEIFFTPTIADTIESDIEIEFTKKIKCYIKVIGCGKNVDVSLSTPNIVMEPSFISLSSQQTLRIHNHSDISIKFSWKSFGTNIEEEEERQRLHDEITRMESIEYEELMNDVANGCYGEPDEDDDNYSHPPLGYENSHNNNNSLDGYYNTTAGLSLDARAAQATLVRKYRNLRKALEHDPMHFVDDIFEITPIEGTVWAKSDIEITISFRPDTAASYTCLSFLDISGREDRLPLHLSGTGIGPHATLSFDIFDIGDVFVNSLQEYEVIISNKGDIPAEWSFIPSLSRLSNKFKFSPRDGILDIGKSQIINIQFYSDIIGEFAETFQFSLQGSEEPLQCIIKGQVIGPTFHFDTKKLDYGIVSYDILHTMSTHLINTSNIDMIYKLYIPQDGVYVKKEFIIEPSHGILKAYESIEIIIKFIPNTVKVYNYTLAIDIDGVGENVSSIPLLAECIVSTIKLPQKELSFGNVFLRYSYTQEMILINQSNIVETKCIILPQQQHSKGVALYTVTPDIVIIPIGGTCVVKFTFQSEKLGSFKIPVVIMIAGSQEPPIQAALSCYSIGPTVIPDKTEIRWGNVECLINSSRNLLLSNTSLISASCKLFLKMARSKYSLSIDEIIIEPNSVYEVTITANLDDTIVHEDELHILIQDGNNIMIPLIARGIGTSIYCETNIKEINFDIQLTNIIFEKKIILENKGRRQQQLKWINYTNREENSKRLILTKKLLKEGKRIPKSLLPLEPSFTVEPSEITLRPRTATTFIFRGTSPNPGEIHEIFLLESKVGKERNTKTIITSNIRANIVNPLLVFSVKEVKFHYQWERNIPPTIQKQEITLTNSTNLILNFLLKVDMPFNLNSWEYSLNPGQSIDLIIEFDPMYRNDLQSHSIDKFLLITYRGHPQKDTLPLHANILFPNLEFETLLINFGCILNETTKTCKVRVKNWSQLDATYHWIFLESDDGNTSGATGTSGAGGSVGGKHKKGNSHGGTSTSLMPPSQIFDILPINSILPAGCSEDIEFTMYGHSNNKLSCHVLCHVDGGPEYKLTLQGESSIVTFTMDRDYIDYGEILYCDKKDETIILTNNSKVPFNFTIDMNELSKIGIIEAIPSYGKVLGGEHFKIILRFSPGIPTIFTETVIFHIAHFDPIKITCVCKGIFPAIAITLPRYKKFGPLGETKDKNLLELWNNFTNQAKENLINPEISRYPPKLLLENGQQHVPSGTSALPPQYKPLHATDALEDTSNPTATSSSSLTLPLKFKDPAQLAIDVEMHRLAFCKHLNDLNEELNNPTEPGVGAGAGGAGGAGAGGAGISPKNTTTTGKSSSRNGKRNSDTSIQDLAPLGVNKIIVAQYLCDFGNVISGTSKKKVFKIINSSTTGPLTWIFDKQVFAGTGFNIDPDKVSKLPEGGIADIIIKFLARGKLNLGRQTCIVPIHMKNSPTINIILSVNVCLPDLILSSDYIDFDKVHLGCSKKIYLRFENITPVTTYWTLKKPGISKDENRFIINPMSGSIRSGQSIILEVEYIPNEIKKHKIILNLKIEMNNKTKKTLTLCGEGIGSSLRFDPSHVEFGPILPFSSGEDRIITLHNDGEYPIEIFSLDFDKIYKEEDEILQSIDSSSSGLYEGDGILRTPIRHAGETLPKVILDAYKAAVAAAAASSSSNEEIKEENDTTGGSVLYPPRLRQISAPRDDKKHQDFLIIGPTLVGVTTAANKLGKSLELPVFTLDQIIRDVANTLSPIGLIARRILNQCTPLEIEETATILANLIEAANKSRDAIIETFKKQKKGKNKEIPEEEFRTPEVIQLEEFQLDSTCNKSSIAKILSHRVEWEDCGYGMIIDGVSSILTDEPTVIAGIALAFPNIIIAQLTPVGGEQGYITRLLSLYEKKTSEVEYLKSKLEEKVQIIKPETGRSKLSRGNSTSRSVVAEDVAILDRKNSLGSLVEDNPIEVALPLGDEPWVDQQTGLVFELSDDEYKSLEPEQKTIYATHLKYHRYIQLEEAKTILKKLNSIFDPETSTLKTSSMKDNAAAAGGASAGGGGGTETTPTTDTSPPPSANATATATTNEKILFYDQYISTVCCELTSAFSKENNNSSLIPHENEKNQDENDHELISSIPSNIYVIEFEEDHDAHNVFQLMKTFLPPPLVPPPDKNALPPSVIYQIFKKPYPRLERKPIHNFQIFKYESSSSSTSTSSMGEEVNNELISRWVIPSKSFIQFRLHYQSIIVGKNESNLNFEIVGTQQVYTLYATGICEVPQIQNDTRSIFMRRVKNIIPGQPPPNKRYITSDDYYSFGPLLKYKQRDWRIEPSPSSSSSTVEDNNVAMENYKSVVSTNMDIMRITNNGKYKCSVDFGFDNDGTSSGSGSTSGTSSVPIFYVEPSTIELEEGETKEIKIWAFPIDSIEYNQTLIACVSNNPQPLFYRLNCWGVEPTIELIGPWEESMNNYLNELNKKKNENKPDMKLIKEMEGKYEQMKGNYLLDFDRILIHRTEIKSFQIKNTSLLPISWDIDNENIKNYSNNIIISPLSGVIPSGSTMTITVSFYSNEPLLCSTSFILRYSDNENGLKSTSTTSTSTTTTSRINIKKFLIQAEAYNIQAVSLTALGQQEGGNEIDMGRIRVGDYVKKKFKMANRGKYRIGYNFQIKKLLTASLVKIVPEEGLIEPNGEVEITITFCSPSNEINFKGNKDIRILIIEPLTGEKVEEFNLLLSVNALYNRFRMQPAKGISFGAMKYDSPVKTKRIELRNEGYFEFIYIICGALSEVDEIDLFDLQTFGCYAYATPPARRITELGENYLTKLENNSTNNTTKGNKKDNKKEKNSTTNKNKVTNVTDENGDKPIIFDPDEIPEPTIPDNPLELGAFHATPRIGILQPGESIGIDISFHPSGCKTFKEKFRICISGSDHKDSASLWARSFEVIGESCTPAIVTDDLFNIFEEQQIVQSLIELNTSSNTDTTSNAGGAVKLENIGVGKVVYSVLDKMLAFGPVLCGPVGGKPSSVERIKITNPTKIDVKVGFTIQSLDNLNEMNENNNNNNTKDKKNKPKDNNKAKKGKGDANNDSSAITLPNAFTVQPEIWEIPPHEHRYVNIYFNPTEIKSYRSIFTAIVEDNITTTSTNTSAATSAGENDDKNKKLIFDLGGSGTMPCIAIEQPTDRDIQGCLFLDFNRVHCDRLSTKTIVLRNDGVMTTTCLFELSSDMMYQFSHKDSSLTLKPGERHELSISFIPKNIENGHEEIIKSTLKISVLNNPFDKYSINLLGTGYSCDAIIETSNDDTKTQEEEIIKFPHINLTNRRSTATTTSAGTGTSTSTETILLKSRSSNYLKFQFLLDENIPKLINFKPSIGHLAPHGVKEITLTFDSSTPVKIESGHIYCNLQEIQYKKNENTNEDDDENEDSMTSLRGKWDDSMISIRPVTQNDLDRIAADAAAFAEYQSKLEAENKKGKKAKPIGPPPEPCGLKLLDIQENGDEDGDGTTNTTQMVQEILPEPLCEINTNKSLQTIKLICNCSADYARYTCPISGQNIIFRPTFLYQTSIHKFSFKNESTIDMPLTWIMEPMKRKGQTRNGTGGGVGGRQSTRGTTTSSRSLTIPNPFTIIPETCIIHSQQEQEFIIKFNPLEVDDFVYLLQGNTLPCTSNPNETALPDGSNLLGPIRIYLKGEAKRPICHFNLIESPDYLLRRPPGMKNEVGLYAPIEVGDLKIIELESTGLRVRNTFRFAAINPTADNYEFKWEPMGDSSPFWRCALGAGILFAGKSTEMIFEYLPEEETPAEAFFRFSLPTVGLSQIFLFAGKVAEPKVNFSTSKIDFHSVVLEGEGSTEILYIENKENIPFSFAFDKVALQNLEGPSGPILIIEPRSGTVPPNSRFPVEFLFKPQEEIHYNLNISCEIKRKPQKLSVNIKGEGYAVHPLIQLENSNDGGNSSGSSSSTTGGEGGGGGGVVDHFMTLKPSPAINYADFGAVQVLDSITKTFTVTNNGKYNFDYNWETDIDVMTSSYLSLTGGKLGGTLQKGIKIQYDITFAPQKEINIDGVMITFTVAGKYSYNIMMKGSGIQPAIRFSFLHYNFGTCFVTSPGGNTVIEEINLKISNHDTVNNITIDCNFQKTRALWCECPPVVLEPGGYIDVPIRFAPRDVKEYAFIIPFLINGTGKINVNITGEGILPRLELANVSQRRTNFGLVDVGTEVIKTITLLNKSIRALPVQLLEDNSQYGGTTLSERCVSYTPKNEFIIQPRDKATIQLIFSPNRRIPQFTEELMVGYAGITRKILSISGKAQGCEVSLDTDSLPFGVVVIGSRKVKKLSLENTGDLSISFQWNENTFGPHFKITPLSGKLAPGNEITFEVILFPQYPDPDIRQENIMLMIPGQSPLNLTCSGSCISQPSESIISLYFDSLVRKIQKKEINLRNPSDKEWFITPSLNGIHWNVPNEIRIPPKGSTDMIITYYPLVMCPKSSDNSNDLTGQLFIPLPDGTAQLYNLYGTAGPPESNGTVYVETQAKKHCMISLKMSNWLSEIQKFHITIDIIERPSLATFFIAANAVEVAAHGSKDFQVRFNSYMEGTTKACIKFTNQLTNEYFYYDIIAKATTPILLEDIYLESSVRQSVKHMITIENPLPSSIDINMGTIGGRTGVGGGGSDDWWSCDSKCIRVKQIVPLTGNHEGSFEIEYRPLIPTIPSSPQEHLLTIMTRELGTFKYKLIVTALPSSIRQTLNFEVSLGSIQTETFIFKAYDSKPMVYNCIVKNPNYFIVNKTISVPAITQWDGEDIRLPITFEPSNIGVVNDVLTITANDGSCYECELVGRCVPPLPLGPYNFTIGLTQDIPFRNCFIESCQWSFIVDSSCFTLAVPNMTIPAKSDGICSITFNPSNLSDSSNATTTTVDNYITAKLFIRCDSKPNLPPWIVYLRGKLA